MTEAPAPRPWSGVLAALLVVYLLVVLRTAWMCDDAYITFRTVDNAVHGYGFRWNVHERVQAYTNPAWMLLMTAFTFVTREAFYTGIGLSLVCSGLAAYIIAFRVAATPAQGAAALIALTVSRAYMDFSTSGLENPLTHLMVACFLWVLGQGEASPRRVGLLSLFAALGVTNRMDTALVFAPAVAWEAWRLGPRSAVVPILVGALPFFLWEAFATLYYGFPVPNTAVAKLNNGIPGSELRAQGVLYLVDSLVMDPVSLGMVGLAGALVLMGRARSEVPLALGMALYLLYIVRVGGDFMSGRFVALPFLVGAGILARTRLDLPTSGAWAAVALVLGFAAPYPSLTIARDYRAGEVRVDQASNGIMDERAYYHHEASLAEVIRGAVWPRGRYKEPQAGVFVLGAVGYPGYFLGPEARILDPMALGDALLSRMPALKDDKWRPGHFRRAVPPGYKKTLETGENHLADPGLKELYDRLGVVTRGPIFSGARFAEIVRFNTGAYDDLVDAERWRKPLPTNVTLGDAAGTAFGSTGIEIALGALEGATALDLEIAGALDIRVELLAMGGRRLSTLKLASEEGENAGHFRVDLGTPAVTAVRVIPTRSADERSAIEGSYDLVSATLVRSEGGPPAPAEEEAPADAQAEPQPDRPARPADRGTRTAPPSKEGKAPRPAGERPAAPAGERPAAGKQGAPRPAGQRPAGDRPDGERAPRPRPPATE